MIPEAFLQEYLSSHPGVWNYTSREGAGGIAPHPAPDVPDAAYPLVTYQLIGVRPVNTLKGATDLCASRFLVNCWSPDFETALGLGEQVRLALNGYRNFAFDITDVQMENGFTDFDEEERVWRRVVEVVIWHKQTLPE